MRGIIMTATFRCLSARPSCVRVLCVLLVVASAARAGAQPAAADRDAAVPARVTVSGELVATYGPEDPGFFNYATYAYEPLRNVRATLDASYAVATALLLGGGLVLFGAGFFGFLSPDLFVLALVTAVVNGMFDYSTGLLRATGAGLGISVTGIAGPGGGSAEKPVGLVYIGVACLGRETILRRNLFSGNRTAIRTATVDASLALATEALLTG